MFHWIQNLLIILLETSTINLSIKEEDLKFKSEDTICIVVIFKSRNDYLRSFSLKQTMNNLRHC